MSDELKFDLDEVDFGGAAEATPQPPTFEIAPDALLRGATPLAPDPHATYDGLDHLELDIDTTGASEDTTTPTEFLCGSAGTGKTFEIKRRLAEDPNYAVLAASTGIAAINLGATTIHSLLGFFDMDSLRDAYLQGSAQRKLRKIVEEGYENVVLDEISMVSADMLDTLMKIFDEVNDNLAGKRHPIGLVLVGDFAQLPPIPEDRNKKSSARKGNVPWAFQAISWPRFESNTTRLTKVWRQADTRFLTALNYARSGRGRDCVELLGSAGVEFHSSTERDFDGTTIVSMNNEVDRHNSMALDKVQGRLVGLPSRRWGKLRAEWKNIPERTLVRENAYVMLLANKSDGMGGYQYVNGDCGHVRGIRPSSSPGQPPYIEVELVRNNNVVLVSPLVRGMEFKEKPDGMTVEVSLPASDDVGQYLAQPHYRGSVKRYVTGQVEFYPMRLAYASTVHKCVARGTRILIEGKGSVRIEDARIGDWVDTGTGTVAKLIATAHASKPIYKITTECGHVVKTSADHRWLTMKGLRETSKLTVGSKIKLCPPTKISGTNEVDRDIAWWIGAVIGDGNCTDKKEGQIHFAGIDEGMRDRFNRIAQRLGGRPNTRSDKRGCHVTNLPLRLRMEAMGLDYSTATHKSIPEVIWRSGKHAWGAFLQGLFDTDGSIMHSRLVLCSTSTKLSEEVQYMLLCLGIRSTRSQYTITTKGRYEGKQYWHIRVTSQSLDEFKAMVGFSMKRKAEVLAKWKPNRIVRKFEEWDSIKKIEKIEGVDSEVVDVELDTVHLLSFNGIMGSNSQGLSLDRIQVDYRNWSFGGPGMVYVSLSRGRTMEGLRLVGTKETIAERCKTDPKVSRWL